MNTDESALKILVVDDYESIRLIIGEALTHYGYAVEVAGDGMIAMEILNNSTPDAVIMDFDLPGMNGHDICASITTPGLPTCRLL